MNSYFIICYILRATITRRYCCSIYHKKANISRRLCILRMCIFRREARKKVLCTVIANSMLFTGCEQCSVVVERFWRYSLSKHYMQENFSKPSPPKL